MRKPYLDAPTSPTVDEWSPRQLARLLRLAIEDSGPPDRRSPAHAVNEIENSLARLCRGRKLTGSSLLSAALSRTSTIDELRHVKSEAKRLIETAPPGPHRDAAKILYHLCVAKAFIRFGVTISRTPAAKRRPLYREFADAFAGHPVGRVFAEAARSGE